MSLRALRKYYGDHAVLHAIDLDVTDGELIVLVGPSGCGKSTLLRIIAGLEEASDGRILMDAVDVTTQPPVQRGVSMVFQNYALYPHMTVEQNIGFGLRIAGVGRLERQRAVREAARTLQLEPLLTRKPAALSGGQRQRVAIGRAMVRKPRLFLFDEPLSNLDTELRVHMRLEIARLHQSLATTMIYVTHDQVEAMTLGDRLVVLRGGRIEQVGTPSTLYNQPANRFVAGFLGTPKMNFVEGTVTAFGGVSLSILAPKLCPTSIILERTRLARVVIGQPVTLGWRPNDVASRYSNDLAVECRVDVVEWLGSSAHLYLLTKQGAALTMESRSVPPPRAGDSLTIGLNPAACLVFASDGSRIA